MRVFLAIEIPEKSRRRLSAVRDELAPVSACIRWADFSNIHLTLLFFGELAPSGLPVIRDILDRNAATQTSFSCVLQGVGFFGPARAPRILWADVRGIPAPFLAWRENVGRELRSAGIAFDEKPFVPHVTIGRVKSPGKSSEFLPRLDSFKNTMFGPVPVDRITLMSSVLDRQGAVYSVQHASRLKPAATPASPSS